MKIPCKECIAYPMCIGTTSIVDLVEKCSILSDSIWSTDDAIKSIYVINPPYFREYGYSELTLELNGEAIYRAAYKSNYRRMKNDKNREHPQRM